MPETETDKFVERTLVDQTIEEMKMLNELRDHFHGFRNNYGGLPNENQLRKMAKDQGVTLYDVLKKLKDWKDGK